MTFSEEFLSEAAAILKQLDTGAIERMASLLREVRNDGGRLFVLGVGGSAANASHAVNDFRKIASMEAYAPTDNVAELTARVNDEGWPTIFEQWLRVSRLTRHDAVFVLSVGGGDMERHVSPNLVVALQYARSIGSKILGVVGRDGGYTATVADACAVIPTVNASRITPHTEALQAIVCHLLVSHPMLQVKQTRWEAI